MSKNEIQTMIFDRTDPHAIAWVGGKPPHRHCTEIEDLRENPRIFRRTDMGMVNIWYADGSYSQLCCYFTPTEIRWCGTEKYFTEEQKIQLEAHRQKLIEVVKEFPEMEVYLGIYNK